MKDNTTNILFEEESKFIAPRNVHSITCSEKNVRMMLVVCANSWQVIEYLVLRIFIHIAGKEKGRKYLLRV